VRVIIGLCVTALTCTAEYGTLPLAFEPTEDKGTCFFARGPGYEARFESSGAVQITGGAEARAHVRMSLVGGRPRPKVSPLDPLPGKVQYFLGSGPRQWRTNVATFGGIRFEGVYKGVDLTYHGRSRELEYDLILVPGASHSQIRVRIEGAEKMRVEANGELAFSAGGIEFRYLRPRAYQTRGGRQLDVSVRYVPTGDVVRFQLDGVDSNLPLVIDPVVTYTTLAGGIGDDRAAAIAIDGSGYAYVAGTTWSSAFGTSTGQTRATPDAFVMKLDPTGSTAVYTAFLGGTASTSASGIAVDSAGNVYVAGTTLSTTFPTTSGAYRTTSDGQHDGFITKLDPTGSTLLYSTYLGGSGDDFVTGLALTASGEAVVVGYTTSLNFPVVSGAVQQTYAGNFDGFIARLNSSGTALSYGTYMGGTGNDTVNGVALDSGGNIYVTGQTQSADFPTLNPVQSCISGGINADAFVTKLSTAGSLVYSTCLGGTGSDIGTAIAVDSLGNAYVAGATSSTDFPATAGSCQGLNRGEYDAFVASIAASGSALRWATYFGGSAIDTATGIALDSAGDVYITGYTRSTDFPVASFPQGPYHGGSDGFVAEFSAGGAAVSYSGMLGGSADDEATAIALDSVGDAYIAGYTLSTDFSATLGGFQTFLAGSVDAFITRVANPTFQPYGASVANISGVPSLLTLGQHFTATIEMQNTGGLLWQSVAINSDNPFRLGSTGDNFGFSRIELPVPEVAPGQAASFTITATAPTVPGSYTLGLRMVQENVTWFGGTSASVIKVAGGAPSVVVNPSSGTGSNQTFSFVFSDTAGATDLNMVQILFNSAFSGVQGCYLWFDVTHSAAYLVDDGGGTSLGPLTLGTANSLSNSQCTLNGTGSSLTSSGNTLSLNLAISFKPGFAGSKTVYGYAVTTAGISSNWQTLGSWTVPGTSVSVVSVTPASGTGINQTFGFVFSDTAGANDLNSLQIIFNSAFTGVQACYLWFDVTHSAAHLVNDAGSASLGPLTLGTANSLSNSQCTLNGTGSSVVASGNTLTLNLAISFKSSFAGSKSVYGYAMTNAGINSGWQSSGSWTVPGAAVPVVAVSPSSGSGRSQTFGFALSDMAGASDLNTLQIILNSDLDGVQACYVWFDVTHSAAYLVNDPSSASLGPLTLGTSSSLSNSQCTLNGTGSSVVASGNTLALNLSITFKPSFAGSKTVYGYAVTNAGISSGWQTLGSWTVQ